MTFWKALEWLAIGAVAYGMGYWNGRRGSRS